MERDVYIVLLQFGRIRENESVSKLKDFARKFASISSGVCRIVVVDNSIADENQKKQFAEPGYVYITGDNTNREFSGYDKGIEFLEKSYNVRDNDILILANDTFYTNYGTSYLEGFNDLNIQISLEANSILGYLDSYPEEVSVLGLNVRSWIRTSLLVMEMHVSRQIGKLSTETAAGSIFSDDLTSFFKLDAPLSNNYQKYLKIWLFDDEIIDTFSHKWHSRTILNKDTFKSLQAKAHCIISEHYFSARARSLGILLFPVNRRKNPRFILKVIFSSFMYKVKRLKSL